VWCHTVTTATIALGIIWPHKPHHVKVGIPSAGCNSYRNVSIFTNIRNKTLHFRSIFRWNRTPEEGTNGTHLCKCCLQLLIQIYYIKVFIYQLTHKRQYQDAQYNCENYYNNIKINRYKNVSIVTNIQTKHCISDASSGEIAHV
jgi:hypothetical protein